MAQDLRHLVLSTARLALSPYRHDDAPEAFAAITPTLARFMSWEPPASVRALDEALTVVQAGMAEGRAYDPVVVRLAASGEFLGMAGIHRLDGPEPEPGVWIREAAHGHGYGREAVAALIAWAAGTLGVRSVIYPVVDQNRPSRRLAERLGGAAFGTRPLRKPGGAEHTLVLYRIPARA